MIKKVETKKDLYKFIYYITKLYKDDDLYVFPIFNSLKKELKIEVLKDNTYTAILAYKNDEIVGRIMYTIDDSKKQGKKVCYYSFFDCINSLDVVKELFEYVEEDMKGKGIDYLEGTFAPYDPDTRRGVLVSGFDISPVIFTSYNYDYYGKLLEEIGFAKAIDTVLLNADVTAKSKKRLGTISRYFERSNDVRVDPLNFKDLDRDMDDVFAILQLATNEIVYQDAPTMDMVENAARQMKFFINPNLIRIARENKTNKPVGFCLVLPDYNQVFKKTKGRLRLLKILIEKKRITKARGMMQYIVPEYQNTGLIGHMFKVIFDELEKIGIYEFEAGTMMEDNPKPINAFKKFGGEIIKVYRIYGKDI
jgi:GNAT superfamily N-acetyltransferase